MENMEKGLTVPKWVLIVWLKIPQMPQRPELTCPICLGKPKSSWFQCKKASLGVCSPWEKVIGTKKPTGKVRKVFTCFITLDRFQIKDQYHFKVRKVFWLSKNVLKTWTEFNLHSVHCSFKDSFCIRRLSRFFYCLVHPNLSATLATDQKWPLSHLHISYQSLAECRLNIVIMTHISTMVNDTSC